MFSFRSCARTAKAGSEGTADSTACARAGVATSFAGGGRSAGGCAGQVPAVWCCAAHDASKWQAECTASSESGGVEQSRAKQSRAEQGGQGLINSYLMVEAGRQGQGREPCVALAQNSLQPDDEHSFSITRYALGTAMAAAQPALHALRSIWSRGPRCSIYQAYPHPFTVDCFTVPDCNSIR